MIPVEERLTFLQAIPIFAGLSSQALSELTGKAREVACPGGSLAVHQGDLGNEMFIIHSGKVEVLRHVGEAAEVLVTTLQARDFFGEMCIIECIPRCASVRAVEDTILFGIKSMHLFHLYQHCPEQYSIVILNIARDLSRRLRKLEENWAAVAH
jgi:CRP/FNR family transcriptional regulator, cyclic AMP receptor protein